jgi:hypothetical protein
MADNYPVREGLGGGQGGVPGGSWDPPDSRPNPSWAVPHGPAIPRFETSRTRHFSRFPAGTADSRFPGYPGIGSRDPSREGPGTLPGRVPGPSGEGFRDPSGRVLGPSREGFPDPPGWRSRTLDRGDREGDRNLDPGILGMLGSGFLEGGSGGSWTLLLMYTCELD